MDPGFGEGGRLFFAAVPDVDAAAEIYRIAGILKRAHRFAGKLIPRECLHVSLLFLGRGSEQLVRGACEAVASVKPIPFEVSFDRTASFRGRPGNRPFVLVGDDTQDRLKSLGHALDAAIAEKGLCQKGVGQKGVGRRAQRDFTPHVTLLYGDRAVDEYPVAPIRWTVNEFVLIHSLKGHRHVARWRFDV
jgi:RNA 2',3'-cyclic 3'-phosphodiesterase